MKMPKVKNIGALIFLVVLATAALALMIYNTTIRKNRRCKGIEVKIIDNANQFLVSKDDVENWVTQYKNDPFDGKIIDKINLGLVEQRVKKAGFVKNCEAYNNLQGYLVVEIEPYKPIARILGNNGNSDRYLDDSGAIFPLSKHFSANVTLIGGDFFDNIHTLKDEKNKDVLALINTINADEFWHAQVTQVDIDKSKEVFLEPQLGDHSIEFGQPEKVKSKFEKLLVFYKQIMPVNEWKAFSKVSVKYDGQIVCN